ncbi:MAG: lipopolysaccharide biosynthesis protein [Phyllobacterium sp.]
MAPSINVKSVTNNVGWSVLSKISTFGLKFVTVPILARILTPEEFGVVAVALTVVQFLSMISSAGLAAALVVQPDEDAETHHSVFWANLGISISMAAILYVWSGFFATLLGSPEAAYLLEVMALLIPIQLAGDVSYALLSRRMAFQKDAFWSVLSESLGALVAVGLALMGWGIWALVIQQFVTAIVRLIGASWSVRYWPRLAFNLRKLGHLAKFSVGVMGSELANFVTFQSPLVIISRNLGLADAGAYSAANRFSSIPNQVILSALMGVLFPVFSHMTEDRERRANALALSTQVTTVVIAPMMFGLWAIAEPAMRVIFGANWAYAWPILGLLALSKGIMTPCSTFIPYLKGLGQARVLWWTAFLRAILVYGCVWYGAATGNLYSAMVWLCIANAITLVGYTWIVFRVNGTPFLKGFYGVSRPMIMAALMAWLVRLLVERLAAGGYNAIWQIIIGGAAGAVFYGLIIVLTERPLVRKLVQLVRERKSAALPA